MIELEPAGQCSQEAGGAIRRQIDPLQEGDDVGALVVRRGVLGPRPVPRQCEHQIEVDAEHVGQQVAGARAGLALAGHPAADGAARHVQPPRQLGGVPAAPSQLPPQPPYESLVLPTSCFHLEIIVDNSSN
jgi:hypothetical protein